MHVVSAGSIIKRSFAIYLKNFVPFTSVMAVMHVPIIIYVYLTLQDGPQAFIANSQRFNIITTLGSLVLTMIATGAITYGTVKELRGQHAPLMNCIGVGFAKLFPVIGTAMLFGMALVGGFILFVIPGIFLLCMLWLAIPSVVIEGNGGMAALKRSKALTDGYRGQIFTVLAVLFIINLVVVKLLERLMLSGADLASQDTIMTHIGQTMMLSFGVGILFSAATAVANAVTYHDIRLEKEGVDAEALAAVFE
jgi:hypothetical protein